MLAIDQTKAHMYLAADKLKGYVDTGTHHVQVALLGIEDRTSRVP
jgi:hypothetical protein